jgi:hypothetical protein
MKKVFIPFCFVAMTSFACDAKSISVGELPASAQVFLKEFYENRDISYVEIEKEEFKVGLNFGGVIEFDKHGRWLEIKDRMGIPLEVLPLLAREYLDERYKDMKVLSIKKENQNYEAKLKNGTELLFSHDGSFILKEKD